MTKWKETIEAINSLGDEEFSAFTIKNKIFYRHKSINCNISLLRKLGYVKRIIDGIYVKVKQIPEDLSKTKSLMDLKDPLFLRNLKIQSLKENITKNKIS